MDYVSVAEARAMAGLRLALSVGVPGPWGESAKAVLRARRVPFVAVAQTPLAENAELLAWTGVRNAPVAVLDDEPAACGWRDILMLAERLGSGPSLLPDDAGDRAACLALAHDICGEDGIGWNRRLSIMAAVDRGQPAAEMPAYLRAMRAGYGAGIQPAEAAPARIAAILHAIAARLHAQQAQGRTYLFGDRLSAADLYWACFSQMIVPLPQEVNPMPAYLRPLYETIEPEIAAAIDPILLTHRDRIYRDHIGLPLDY